MVTLMQSVLALSCIYNNSVFISRPDNAIGEEAFLCSSYDHRQLPCSWPTEWRRLFVKTVNLTNMFVIENITNIHFFKIRYVLKARQYADSQWIPVMKAEMTTSEHTLYIAGFIVPVIVSFMCGCYVIYKKKLKQ